MTLHPDVPPRSLFRSSGPTAGRLCLELIQRIPHRIHTSHTPERFTACPALHRVSPGQCVRGRTPTAKVTTYTSIGQRSKSLGCTLQPITTQPPKRMGPFRPTRSTQTILLAFQELFGQRPPVDLSRLGISSALPHLSPRHGSGVRTGTPVRECLPPWNWTGDWPPPGLGCPRHHTHC